MPAGAMSHKRRPDAHLFVGFQSPRGRRRDARHRPRREVGGRDFEPARKVGGGHFRHGRRYALAATMLGRAFLAWLMSDYIHGFGLYPAAFGVLARLPLRRRLGRLWWLRRDFRLSSERCATTHSPSRACATTFPRASGRASTSGGDVDVDVMKELIDESVKMMKQQG